MLDPLEIPADLRVSGSPKILPIKSTNNTYNFNVSKKLKNINCRNGPLQISFWPRGRTSVRPRRTSLRSLIVESTEVFTGIIRPLNFTLNLISKLPLSLELPFSIFHLFSVSVFIFLILAVSGFLLRFFFLIPPARRIRVYNRNIRFFI